MTSSNKTANTKNLKTFDYKLDDDGIALITFEVHGETQNVLKPEFAAEIEQILADINAERGLKGIIIQSGKDNSFIAGADISVLSSVETAEQAAQIGRTGQELFARLEKQSVPIVAAIHGPCLGGGLELALACSSRIASDDKITKLGLPEVQLGLLPGSGGTQRLPRLIGIAAALDLMLTGKQIFAKKAKSLGLVDEVVPKANLLKAARKKVLALAKNTQAKKSFGSYLNLKSLQKLVLESNSVGRNVIFEQARKQVEKKTKGNYPAPKKIIKCVETGQRQGFEEGLQLEAKSFGELVVSKEAQALMSIFFATVDLKKDSGIDSDEEAVTANKVGVLGGGLMGSGIAYVSMDKAGKQVRIKDVSHKGVANALNYSWKLINKKLKRRFISQSDASRTLANLTGTTDYSGFKDCEVVVEAVFEDLELKHQMLKEVEENCAESTIFATNTSSIPITDIAKAAKNKAQVVGLHYFSPVEKMPLLEIIATKDTADWVIATCVELGKKQGKTPIVVNDGAGFYVNRILTPYMNEAGIILNQGVAIEKIDEACINAGFPIGPIQLVDEVGIDVATKVAPILESAFGERMALPKSFDKLLADDRKGRKNGRGFYQYGKKVKGKQVDESVYQVLGVNIDKEAPASKVSSKEIVERGLLLMANEAVRCLDEGIIRNPRDGDIGAIFGIGFPPFLGGPFRYLESMGLSQAVQKMQAYQKIYGERFAPAEMLVDLAEKEQTFH